MRFWAAGLLALLFAAPAHAQDCSQESRLRSPSAGAPTTIEFRNRADRERHLYWLDANGQRKPYGTVAPGGTLTERTFVSHIWVVAGPADRCMAIVTATQAPLVVDVTNAAAATVRVAPPPPPAAPRAQPVTRDKPPHFHSRACSVHQVYSGSMKRCIPKSLSCNNNQVYSSSLRQCIPKVILPKRPVKKKSACPYNLTRICTQQHGKIVCRCAS